MRESAGRKPPATHQPTKAEMEEVIVIDGTPDEIAAAVVCGGASPRPKTRKSVSFDDE